MTCDIENEEWIAWGQELVSFGLQVKQQVRAAIERIVSAHNSCIATEAAHKASLISSP